MNQKNILFIPKEPFNKKTACPGYFWILAHPRRSWGGLVVPLGTGGPSKLLEVSWYHARHVIPCIYCKAYGKLSLFIFLTLYQHLGSKGAKFADQKHVNNRVDWYRFVALITKTAVKLQMFGGETCHVHVKVDHAGYGKKKKQTKITYAARAQTLNRLKSIIMGHRDLLS